MPRNSSIGYVLFNCEHLAAETMKTLNTIYTIRDLDFLAIFIGNEHTENDHH